jgi:hypothetical protein
LAKGQGTNHFYHFHPDPNYVLSVDSLETMLQISPTLRSISSHSLRRFPTRIANRRAFYITFLRKPADIFISVLRHTQREFRNMPEAARVCWPKETPDLSLRDLTAFLLGKSGENPRYCPLSHFFCDLQSIQHISFANFESRDQACQDVASLILGKFLMVGFVENMTKSLNLLQAKLRGIDYHIRLPINRHLNRGKGSKNTSWLTEKDEVGAKLLAMTAFEQRLYDEMYRQFSAEYQAFKSQRRVEELPGEVEGFETIDDWARAAIIVGIERDRAGSSGIGRRESRISNLEARS